MSARTAKDNSGEESPWSQRAWIASRILQEENTPFGCSSGKVIILSTKPGSNPTTLTLAIVETSPSCMHGEEKSTSRAMIVFRNQRIGVEKARTRVKVADVIKGSFELVLIDRVTGVNWDKVTNLLRWKGLYTA